MTDSTESRRRQMLEDDVPTVDLFNDDGPTWDTQQLQQDYEVLGFAAPFVVVRRRSDGARGSLEFTHSPRIYFGWVPYREDEENMGNCGRIA